MIATPRVPPTYGRRRSRPDLVVVEGAEQVGPRDRPHRPDVRADALVAHLRAHLVDLIDHVAAAELELEAVAEDVAERLRPDDRRLPFDRADGGGEKIAAEPDVPAD
jgi:hypothetical protein